jgi:hypothetical protein
LLTLLEELAQLILNVVVADAEFPAAVTTGALVSIWTTSECVASVLPARSTLEYSIVC